MYAKCNASVVKIFLKLLNSKTENRLDLFSGKIANALASLHVLDETSTNAA